MASARFDEGGTVEVFWVTFSSLDITNIAMSSINTEILAVSAAFGAGTATSFEVGYTVVFGRRPVISVAKEEESIFDYCDEKVKVDEEGDSTEEESMPLYRNELRQRKLDEQQEKKEALRDARDSTFSVGLVANRRERREILALIGRNRILPYPYVTVFIVLFYFLFAFSATQGLQPAASASWHRSRSGSRT